MSRRKNTHVLTEAKKSITARLTERAFFLEEALTQALLADPVPDEDTLDTLRKAAEKAGIELSEWKASKKAKKKRSVEWTDAEAKVSPPAKRKVREIVNHEAYNNVKNTVRETNSPRPSEWLQEGCLVTRRGSSMTMMVLSIKSNGNVSVLNGGTVQVVRGLSLRPALNDEN